MITNLDLYVLLGPDDVTLLIHIQLTSVSKDDSLDHSSGRLTL